MYHIEQAKRLFLRNEIQRTIEQTCSEFKHPLVQFEGFIAENITLFVFLSCTHSAFSVRLMLRLMKIVENAGLQMGASYGEAHSKICDFTLNESCVHIGRTVGKLQMMRGTILVETNNCGIGCHFYQNHHSIFNQIIAVGGYSVYSGDLDFAYDQYRIDYIKAFGRFPPAATIEVI